MNTFNFETKCWQYYLVLEEDFSKFERYVTFEIENEKTYSVELLKHFQMICSEIDVICKMYSSFYDSETNPKNILYYAHIILSNNEKFTRAEMQLKNNALYRLTPWIEWSCNHEKFLDTSDPGNNTPSWWKDYNKVKHERLNLDENGSPYYKRATLGNTLNALSALFILEMNFYKGLVSRDGNYRITVPSRESTMFNYHR